MTYLKETQKSFSSTKRPEINGDFSLHPLYLKDKHLKKIHLRMSDKVSSLYNINPNNINEETFFAIEFILKEINKIISKQPIDKISEYNNLTIGEATKIILTRLKFSNNVGEVLLYHKVALAESKARNYNLKKESITDPLTKLYNRRIIDSKLDELINEFDRTGKQFSLFILDIDFFKKINDTFGHDMGDDVLIGISNILKRELRKTDIVARWGGEEFLVLLKATKHDIALKKAESLRKIIEKELINHIMNDQNKGRFCLNKNGCDKISKCQNKNLMCFPNKITCSIGVSTSQESNGECETKSHLIKRADSALYIAKESGRNMVYSGKGLEIPKKED